MIAPTALSSLCFPWLLVDGNGDLIQEGDGSLFPKPYKNIESALAIGGSIGNWEWSVCANGYAIYRFSTTLLTPASIILHGLKVNGLSKTQGKSAGLSINVSRTELTSYAQEFCKGLESLDDQYRALIRQNIHEVRGINSALYNSAFELQEILESDYTQRGASTSIAKSVVSLSELLRGRIDFMEFIANPEARNVIKGDIPVYRKFDKVQRCFRVTANKRGIDFEISGSSNKTAYGPPIFDLVPYLLLDNAVKYSPDKFPVKIVCNDAAQSIFCAVTSRGPRITDDELPDIFSPGIRGENALKSKKEGSGLGLSVLKKVVCDVFGGRVSIRQSEDKAVIYGVPYCDVTFELQLPTRSEINRR